MNSTLDNNIFILLQNFCESGQGRIDNFFRSIDPT